MYPSPRARAPTVPGRSHPFARPSIGVAAQSPAGFREGVGLSFVPMRTITLAVLFTVPTFAQWLNLPTPGIPRTADGRPNLTAPLPRMPDGKPDLSGLWKPELTPYRFDVIQDVKDEGIFRPAAEALFLQRAVNLRHDNPVTHCLPAGPQAIFAAGSTPFYRIVQSPNVIALLYELGDFR